jgi:hypothetical protein
VRFNFTLVVWALAVLSFSSSCSSSSKSSGAEVPAAPTLTAAGAAVITPEYEANISPSIVADGSLVAVTVHFKKPMSGKIELIGTFEDQISHFFEVPEKGAGVYEALFGVEHGHKPGKASIKIENEGVQANLSLDIVDGKYPSETLKVDGKRVNPPKKMMKRILSELKEIGKVYAISTPERYWEGPFQLPVDSKITDPFGTKRVYNGQLKSYHGGLDFHAPVGTPIHASGAGVIVLAKNLYYSGNTVIIDHGYGLKSMYFHMSKFKVKLGDKVAKGQLLGLSGKTGRVTGPHLHWQVIVHKIKVNPTGLLEVGK